jgi:O-antigen ligase
VSGMIIILAAAFSGSRRTWIVLSIILIFFAISFLKYSLFGILIFRIKKRQLINIMAVVLVILSIVGIYKYIGFDSQYHQQHYLNKMGKRFVGIRDVFEQEGGAEARIKRYTFAGGLFEEYNTLGLLIGKGSEYMRQYGSKFNARDGFGYPHNLIISAFLHSGILGGLTVIGYLMLSLFLYIKRVKKPIVGYLFALFMITTFYAMTSGNTIFSKKIYIFLLLLPWLIDKIYSKKQLVQNKMVQYNLKPS